MGAIPDLTSARDQYGITPADDRLHQPPGVPGWSENLQLVVNDGRAGVACYVHFSRMVDDPGIWEGILICYLPGGQLRVSRSFARDRGSGAASDGQLEFAPVEPLRRWRLTFDGVARIITRAEAAAGPVTQGPVEPLRLALDVECVTPPWGVGSEAAGGATAAAMHGQSWARVHLEQACRVSGELSAASTLTAIEGMGMRDHSCGPRDYSGMRREAWANAVFPSGRAFCGLWVEVDGAPPFAHGFVYEDGQLHEMDTFEGPPLTSALGDPTTFTVRFASPRGDAEVHGQMLHSMAFTLEYPCRMPLGPQATGAIPVEGPASYTWDGEHGDGWIERIYYREPPGP
ncbi:MAG: DUF7064 domain-containing protein [Solirubrobacteraceae bacterium]